MLNEQEIKDFFQRLNIDARAFQAYEAQWVFTLHRPGHGCYPFLALLTYDEEATPLSAGWWEILRWFWDVRDRPSFAVWLQRQGGRGQEPNLDAWRVVQHELQSFSEIFEPEERAEFFKLMGYKENA